MPTFDAETLIALTIGTFGAVIAIQTAREAKDAEAWRWVAVNALIAVTAVMTAWLLPAFALSITGGVALVLVVAPLTAAAMLRRRLESDDPVSALWLARVLAVLQPGAAARDFVAMCEAAARAEHAGDVSGFRALAQSSVPRLRLWAGIILAQDEERWSDVLDLIQRDAPDHRGFVAPAMRALARLGRHDDMVALYAAHVARLSPAERAASRVHLFHVAGRLDSIDSILARPLRHLHPEARALIRAAAAFRADPTGAQPADALRRLAGHGTLRRVRRSAGHLLTAPPAALPGPEARLAIDAIAAEVEAEARLAPMPLRTAWITLALLASNVIVHAWVLGLAPPGTETRRLLAAGALWTPYVYEGGEWWRTLSATFLHGSWLHVALNMAVLAMFGRIVERFAGAIGYLSVYFGAGVGAFAGIAWLARENIIDDVMVVGASGALFGLVGALLATALRWFVVTRSGVHLRQMRALAIMLAAQIAFDLMVPESSMLGHALGFVIGLALGFTLGPLLWPVRIAPGRSPVAARSYT